MLLLWSLAWRSRASTSSAGSFRGVSSVESLWVGWLLIVCYKVLCRVVMMVTKVEVGTVCNSCLLFLVCQISYFMFPRSCLRCLSFKYSPSSSVTMA